MWLVTCTYPKIKVWTNYSAGEAATGDASHVYQYTHIFKVNLYNVVQF